MPEGAPARKRGGKRQRVVDLDVWCPTSGIELGKKRVPPHKMQVFVCSNGSLMGYCAAHVTRCFIGEQSIVAEIKGHYQVSVV